MFVPINAHYGDRFSLFSLNFLVLEAPRKKWLRRKGDVLNPNTVAVMAGGEPGW